ncbi:MAG: Zn-dependent hydrolase of the beta-lactamase fold-like protein [candidate division CPR2 bacterium GW2011_GWC1_39_9]|nr:MAG: Zn-dependent hydrolase of the beta-lactamase fold-like protein [candidate division CPR2 bacterium GW2011_GWC1_39_9]
MEILYLGHSAFKLVGKNIQIVIDPYGEPAKLGMKPIKTPADVVLITHDHWDHNNIAAISGNPVVFDMPGDYEVKGITFKGINSKHGNDSELPNTIFTIRMEDLTIAHLGDLGEVLSPAQLERMSEIDILMVPVGGKFTINPEQAVEVINQIEPKIIIPMHYDLGSKPDILPVSKFIEEIGMEPEKIPKFKVTKKDLPEEPKLVVLETQ